MATDWRLRTLPDGRRVEFVDACWAPDDGTEPLGSIRVDVSYLLDGALTHRIVLLTSEDIENAPREVS